MKCLTPDRQSALVAMFSDYGNRCKHGHYQCTDRTHYWFYQSQLCFIGSEIYRYSEYKHNWELLGGELLFDWLDSIRQSDSPLYDVKLAQAINYWQSEDKAQIDSNWSAECKALHATGDETSAKHRRYDAVARERYSEVTNGYIIEGYSPSLKMPDCVCVRVRVAGSSKRLYLEVKAGNNQSRSSRKSFRLRLHKVAKLAVSEYWQSVTERATTKI